MKKEEAILILLAAIISASALSIIFYEYIQQSGKSKTIPESKGTIRYVGTATGFEKIKVMEPSIMGKENEISFTILNGAGQRVEDLHFSVKGGTHQCRVSTPPPATLIAGDTAEVVLGCNKNVEGKFSVDMSIGYTLSSSGEKVLKTGNIRNELYEEKYEKEGILGVEIGSGILLSLLILAVVVEALILLAATKILKFRKQDITTAIVVAAISVVATTILNIMFGFVPLIGGLIGLLAGIIVTIYLIKYFYEVGWINAFKAWLVTLTISLLLFVIPMFVVLFYQLGVI